MTFDTIAGSLTYLIIFTLVSRIASIPHITKKRKRVDHESHSKRIDSIAREVKFSSKYFWIKDAQKPFGLFSPIPPQGRIYLSQGVLDHFSYEEMKWVVLHELGHKSLNHSVKLMTFTIIFFFFEIVGILFFPELVFKMIFSIIFGFLSAIISLPLQRKFESEANLYALKNGSSAQAQISATEQFAKFWNGGRLKQSSIHEFFSPQLPYHERINQAQGFSSR